MAFYLSPLVDVNEIDLSTTIPAVATSIGVIVLRDTFKGPENKQTLVADEADLIRAFGEPIDTSYEDIMSATGFLKFGNKLYCTRVMPDDARFAGVNAKGASGADDLTVTATIDTDGAVTTFVIAVAGTGYSVGEFFEIAGGAIGQVTAVTAGVPTALAVEYASSGYAIAPTAVATTATAIEQNLVTGGKNLSILYGDETGTIATLDSGTPVANPLFTTVTDGTYEVSGLTGDLSGTAATLSITFVSNAITATVVVDGGLDFVGASAETITVGFADLGVLSGATTGSVDFTVATLYANAAGVIDPDETTLVSGGTRYVAGQTYEVLGTTANDVEDPAGEGAEITIDTVDSAGTVLTYSVSAGGTGYTAGTLDLLVATGYDLATGTLDDLATGDPDDFGDETSVTSGDLVWTIASSRGNWGSETRIAFLDLVDQTAILQGGDVRSGQPSEAFQSIDSQLSKANDFLVIVQAKDQRKTTWVTKETFNVSTDTNALDDTGTTRYAEQVINQTSQYIRVALSSDLLGDETDAGVITNLASLSSDIWFDLNDGSDGDLLTSDATIIDGYRLYENPEEIDVNLIVDSGKSDTVKLDIISMCEERYDCMAVLDCPKADVLNNKGNEAVDLRTWRNSTLPSSSYASVYGNWLEIYDKFNQKYRWIPASGFVTGVFAKTDDVNDPWWAPAGLNRAILTSVRRLAWNPKMGYRDILYSNGINPIVTFPGEGKVIWGQKTLLSKESAFNRINVRRLFLVLEKAIATSAKYFLFEPNDTATRSLLVNMITPFLRDVQSRRGIYDFKVVCDDSNNTPARVDRNELWCNIFIKPTRTAEFIVLNFVATATGASFEEAAAAV